MTSTENLLQDSDKSPGTFESGYLSDRNEADEDWQEQKEKPVGKKKKSQRNLGLENKGFESDNEHVLDTGSKEKVRVHRTLSEDTNTARKTARKSEHRVDKRRHSYAGRPSSDTGKIAKATAVSSTRRHSSAAEDDLRRRACLNSMRLRRVSSSSQQPLSPEVDTSVDEDVFYDDDFGSGSKKKGQEFDSGERHKMRSTKGRECTVGSVCSAVELENRILSDYSRRLSHALQQRAALEKELNTLRRAASVPRLRMRTMSDKWASSPNIHFRNEKLNSVRRKGRGNEDKKLSFEQLKRQKQTEQSRRLPKVPQSFSSGEYSFVEEIPLVVERNHQRSSQQVMDENSALYAKEKDRNYKSNAKTQPASEEKAETSQRNLTKEFHQGLEEKDRNGRFFLSDMEKERRERKIAELAADLWKKLLQGEKFHGDQEPSQNKAVAESSVETSQRERTDKDKSNDVVQSFSSGEYQFLEEFYVTEKPQRGCIAKLAEETAPSTSGQELQSKMAKDSTLVRSESESSIARTDAFRRNQRRPLRYKRGSTAAKSLTGIARRPSSSGLNDVTPDEDYEDLSQLSVAKQQRETPLPEKWRTEKSNRVQKVQSGIIGSQSTKVVSQNYSKWFDYMLPPGTKRVGKRGVQREDLHVARSPPQEDTRPENAPSLQEKLRYYQQRQEQRTRDENSFDLADKYMTAQDTEEGKELRRQAAGKAAILRREASHLLWEAMNLERICDPNARVRHIFAPY